MKFSPEINIKKKQIFMSHNKNRNKSWRQSSKNFWKFHSFKEFGNNKEKPELQYIHDVLEAHYIHRMQPISH